MGNGNIDSQIVMHDDGNQYNVLGSQLQTGNVIPGTVSKITDITMRFDQGGLEWPRW